MMMMMMTLRVQKSMTPQLLERRVGRRKGGCASSLYTLSNEAVTTTTLAQEWYYGSGCINASLCMVACALFGDGGRM